MQCNFIDLCYIRTLLQYYDAIIFLHAEFPFIPEFYQGLQLLALENVDEL